MPADGPRVHQEFSMPDDYYCHLQKTLRLYHDQVKNFVQKSQAVYKNQFDRNRSNPSYAIGDAVLKRLSRYPSKLAQLYSDPMVVVQANHPTYWLEDPIKKQIIQVHVSQLRSCRF